MKSVRPKLKRRGGGSVPGECEGGGGRIDKMLNCELGTVKEGYVESESVVNGKMGKDKGSMETGQQSESQLCKELMLAKRKLELELRELDLQKREQMLDLYEEQKKRSPRKLFSRQIKEINQNIVASRPDGLGQTCCGKNQAMQTMIKENGPHQEEQCDRRDHGSAMEDISELRDVVRKQQEILDKLEEERQEERLSMKLMAEMLLKDQNQKQEQKVAKNERKKFYVWKKSMNSDFDERREARISVRKQSERGGIGYSRSRGQADKESFSLKSISKEIGSQWTGIRYDRHRNVPVSVTGSNVTKKCLHPSGMFRDAGLSHLLLKNIDKCQYVEPTPVQQYAIPIILEGRDMMACAQSGAGKTAAYLIPVIQMFMNSDSVYSSGQYQPASPTALVIVPTRELVIQVFNDAKKLSQGSMVKPAVLYGGTNPHHQAKDLAAGCNILVATLGRLSDFVARGIVSLSRVKVLVVDEADELVNMDNFSVFQNCVDLMPEKGERQTLMFSASFPDDIQSTAWDFMHDYAFLSVGLVDATLERVVQKVYKVGKFEKRDKLLELLDDPARDPRERVLIFTQTKRNADFLVSYLSAEGFPVTCIHGGMKQEDREAALDEFIVGSKSMLVATGVVDRAIRGLNVTHIINYDMTQDLEVYRNRIGSIDVEHGKVSTFIDILEDRDLNFEKFSKLMTAEEAHALMLIAREVWEDDEDWG